MNLEQARLNMVQQQVRTWDVFEQRTLDRLLEVPRENFVPPVFKNLAYADTQIPIGHGQIMLSPNFEGRLLQSLNLQKTDSVLEVGTGTGYLTVILAGLVNSVTSVDIYPDLQRLGENYPSNISLQTKDVANGWVQEGGFNVIIISGALAILPKSFLQALHINGRLFAILGQGAVMKATLITRTESEKWTYEELFETSLPFLINSTIKSNFNF
ncbi:protein-L-isoaspartate O-methyltransferase family protein [Candidatus Nitrosacidococcus tergens]|uniref:Protein-L-isoaspartate O-methyltransferase n=1 Tax=Candidatus Nitrosacidococcus tergens TaxID=553981 RepID=A0A7G1Q7D2_9GAMM|nr:protein-L-isoaspartate O-methyltransferase [Candidatus Nitrosacidococcus tergens]CAB1274433.1 Protein-L-isoaspartate(D-aspartate) O-methyltransferase [Candidatus Nitrosacidococcus tergens]